MGHSHSTTRITTINPPSCEKPVNDQLMTTDYRSDWSDSLFSVSDTDEDHTSNSSFSEPELKASRSNESLQGHQLPMCSDPKLRSTRLSDRGRTLTRSTSLSNLGTNSTERKSNLGRSLGLEGRPRNLRSTSLDDGQDHFHVHPPTLLDSAISDFSTNPNQAKYAFRILTWSLSKQGSKTKWLKERIISQWYLIAIKLFQSNLRGTTHSIFDLAYECAVLDRDEDGPYGELTESTADCLWLWGLILIQRGHLIGARNLWMRARVSYQTCRLPEALVHSEFIEHCLRALSALRTNDYCRAITWLDKARRIAPALGATGTAKLELIRELTKSTLDKMFQA